MGDIRIITGPKIFLVGRQTVDEAELARFLADEGVESWETDTEVGGQKLAEIAGRLCYKSYAKPRPGGNEKYLGHILEVGHGSVIESAVYSFIITGVSRSFTHELIRHRAGWSYSQRSQRFCDESGAAFVMPPFIAEACRREFEAGGVDQKLAQSMRQRWWYAVQVAQQQYAAIVADAETYIAATRPGIDRTSARKMAREAARSVLPNATATEIFVTANARALRSFVEQRGALEADAEMRTTALAICRLMKAEAPNLFADHEIAATPEGIEHVTYKFRKV